MTIIGLLTRETQLCPVDRCGERYGVPLGLRVGTCRLAEAHKQHRKQQCMQTICVKCFHISGVLVDKLLITNTFRLQIYKKKVKIQTKRRKK